MFVSEDVWLVVQHVDQVTYFTPRMMIGWQQFLFRMYFYWFIYLPIHPLQLTGWSRKMHWTPWFILSIHVSTFLFVSVSLYLCVHINPWVRISTCAFTCSVGASVPTFLQRAENAGKHQQRAWLYASDDEKKSDVFHELEMTSTTIL